MLDVEIIGFVFGFIPHVFFPDFAAEQIGWPTGSPFQLEVGFHDGAWGLLGFLCIWIGGTFWLATGLGWTFFMLGATYGHIVQTVREGDYAPYNFLTLFSDGFIALWLPVLALSLLARGRVSAASGRGRKKAQPPPIAVASGGTKSTLSAFRFCTQTQGQLIRPGL